MELIKTNKNCYMPSCSLIATDEKGLCAIHNGTALRDSKGFVIWKTQ